MKLTTYLAPLDIVPIPLAVLNLAPTGGVVAHVEHQAARDMQDGTC